MEKAHKMATYFSYGNRHDELMTVGNTCEAPNLRLKVDLNGTRVTAKHGLLYSELRLNRPLKLYALQNSVPWKLSDEEWNMIAEFEGIMRITDAATKLVQHERLFLGAGATALKIDMIEKLRGAHIEVIEMDNVKASPKLPRASKYVGDLSTVGKKCVERAKLEAERRYSAIRLKALRIMNTNPTIAN